jgi:hypothetical protein
MVFLAALSGPQTKAPGFAGGYLLISRQILFPLHTQGGGSGLHLGDVQSRPALFDPLTTVCAIAVSVSSSAIAAGFSGLWACLPCVGYRTFQIRPISELSPQKLAAYTVCNYESIR